jgi:hypothetical protein
MMVSEDQDRPEETEENLTEPGLLPEPDLDAEAEPHDAAEDAAVPSGAEEAPSEPAEDENRKWYVVHSYSGYENKVKKNLEQRIETMGMQDKIFRVVVPTEEEVEIRDGQRTTGKRVFPAISSSKWLSTTSPGTSCATHPA